MLVDVSVSFSEEDASAWKAFTDDDLLGGRSSSLLRRHLKESTVRHAQLYNSFTQITITACTNVYGLHREKHQKTVFH